MTSWKLKVKESKSEKYDFFGSLYVFFFLFSYILFTLITFLIVFLNFVYFHFIKGLVSKSESKVEKEEENAIYRPR